MWKGIIGGGNIDTIVNHKEQLGGENVYMANITEIKRSSREPFNYSSLNFRTSKGIAVTVSMIILYDNLAL